MQRRYSIQLVIIFRVKYCLTWNNSEGDGSGHFDLHGLRVAAVDVVEQPVEGLNIAVVDKIIIILFLPNFFLFDICIFSCIFFIHTYKDFSC